MADTIVCDASAVLAVARNEPGSANAIRHLGRSVISSVNAAEVACILRRRGVPPEEVQAALNRLLPPVVPFEEHHIPLTGAVYAASRAKGLSHADCCCVAVALDRKAAVLTADRQWTDAGLDLEIICIR